VRVDAATANLLGPAFEAVSEDAGAAFGLRGEREEPAAARTLLGRPATFVGRDRELGMLEALFAECEAEPAARAVLVTGEAGMGKSRLAAELLRRLRQRAPDAEVWSARGDPRLERSAFALLGGLVQRAVGLSGGTPREARHGVLQARVRSLLGGDDAELTAELLGEITDAPAAEASPRLLALRRDPLSLGEQIRRACEAVLAAACAARPVVLVLEDLHWGDLPTIAFVDAALRALPDRPLFVLALARPEVHATFPNLWARRDVQVLPLGKLAPRAGERFVRQALGDRLGDAAVRALVERADGNAFFLEELIRAAAEGRGGGALPETILAMVQARLEAMEPEARQVLRAASVFGATFWEAGVAALVGAAHAAEWLGVLAAREVISPPRDGRLAGQVEHDFRHALVQEAAYGMLTPRDRALAHRLAGAWLEAAGEGEAAVLAEHFERGGEAVRAAAFYGRAAERALRGNDLDAAIARAESGLRAGAEGALRAGLVSTLLEAHSWRNDWAEGLKYADEVFAREAPGSRSWSTAALVKVWAAPMLGRLDAMVEAMGPLGSVTPADGAVSELVQALSAVVMALTVVSEHDLAATYLARMLAVAGPLAETDPVVRGWIAVSRGYAARQRDGDLALSFAQMTAAWASFVEAGHPHQIAWAEAHLGIDLWLLGDHAEAVRLVRSGARDLPPGRLPVVASLGKLVLASALSDAGALDDARAEALTMAAAEAAQSNRFFEGMARSVLSEILRRRGDLAGASREAVAAIELLSLVPFDRALALARLSAVRLAQGRAAEALGSAREGLALLTPVTGYADIHLRVALVEALHATGDHDGARAALAEALPRLLARADTLDAAQRESFLGRVPAHARLLALASEGAAPTTATPTAATRPEDR
jgi:tetratricopeptide (TPR) repeat protein